MTYTIKTACAYLAIFVSMSACNDGVRSEPVKLGDAPSDPLAITLELNMGEQICDPSNIHAGVIDWTSREGMPTEDCMYVTRLQFGCSDFVTSALRPEDVERETGYGGTPLGGADGDEIEFGCGEGVNRRITLSRGGDVIFTSDWSDEPIDRHFEEPVSLCLDERKLDLALDIDPGAPVNNSDTIRIEYTRDPSSVEHDMDTKEDFRYSVDENGCLAFRSVF